MNPFGAIAGIALIAGLLASGSEKYVSVGSRWNDDVGSKLTNEADRACSSVNSAIESCKTSFKNIEKLEPVEFNSEADNINRIVERLNQLRREN